MAQKALFELLFRRLLGHFRQRFHELLFGIAGFSNTKPLAFSSLFRAIMFDCCPGLTGRRQ